MKMFLGLQIRMFDQAANILEKEESVKDSYPLIGGRAAFSKEFSQQMESCKKFKDALGMALKVIIQRCYDEEFGKNDLNITNSIDLAIQIMVKLGYYSAQPSIDRKWVGIIERWNRWYNSENDVFSKRVNWLANIIAGVFYFLWFYWTFFFIVLMPQGIYFVFMGLAACIGSLVVTTNYKKALKAVKVGTALLALTAVLVLVEHFA